MKKHSVFICQNCGYQSIGFLGRCPECGAWNSMLEEIPGEDSTEMGVDIKPVKLDEINLAEVERIGTDIGEFDLILGGGIVPGSVVLLGGKPGIGKSTLMLQVAMNLSKKGMKVLYVSGEESLSQVKLRARRLDEDLDAFSNLYFLSETNFQLIKAQIENISPRSLIIDSIQVIYHPELSSSPGTISQVRECAQQLTRLAKGQRISTFLIGHVTKEGTLAGPMVLEHIVDTVLYFEGEGSLSHRVLRAVKNRFGSTNEIGLFEMTEAGLKEVKNPSSVFLNLDQEDNPPGNAIFPMMEGTRPLLLQIQALVTTSYLGFPARKTIGLDHNRVTLLIAVLEKRVGLSLYNQDIFVNVVGGLRINEPAVDLAVVLAIASSFKSTPLPKDMIIFGEVGLGGEVRKVSFADKRVKEAQKLGFKSCLIPRGNLLEKDKFDIKIIEISNVKEAMRILF